MKKIYILTTFLIFFSFKGFCVEPFSVPTVSKNKPIHIDSKRIEIKRNDGKIFFYENVKAKQEKTEFFADKMVANYKENRKNGKTEFSKIDAYGNVRFFSKKLSAVGEEGSFNIPKNEFIVTGNVVINDDGAIVYGEKFTYNTKTQETKIEGNKKEEGRVTIILDNIEDIQQRVEETKNEEKGSENEKTK